MYVYMNVCMYVRMYVCVCVCVLACARASVWLGWNWRRVREQHDGLVDVNEALAACCEAACLALWLLGTSWHGHAGEMIQMNTKRLVKR